MCLYHILGMSCLKINNEEGQTVGVIPIYCGETTLAKLREEIEYDFLFVHGGYKFNTSEEMFTNVASVAHEMVNHSTEKNFFCVTIFKRSKLSGECASTKGPADPSKTTIDATGSMASNTTPLTGTPKTDQNNPCSSTSKVTGSFLRSPTSWEIRGVKIYTQVEIEKAKGMEKKRREFWNKEAKRICRQTKKSKNEVAKEVNIAWRKHQGTLLLEEESLLQKMQKDASEAEGHECQSQIKCKPGTIQKNFDRIQQHKNELDQVINEIENTKCGSAIGKKRKLDELSDKKSYLLVEMKKAQDVMRKNLRKSVNFVKDLSNDM